MLSVRAVYVLSSLHLGVDDCLIETQASNETLKRRLIEREGKTDEVSDGR
jgi:hypothetical protein